MFQVSRRSITLVLCLGKLKLVRDTASYVVNTPPQKNWLWVLLEKKICLATPPYPQPQQKKVPESTRLAGWELN